MEKMLTPYPLTARYGTDRDDKKRLIDRYRVTSDKPLWRGDHSFSSDAAAYSLTNFLEPEIAKKHPDWSKPEVRSEAMRRFEKRLRQDLSYEQKESTHEESAVVWRPIETDKGWELATEYGDTIVTLSELWEHTKEFAAFAGNPAAYNAEEHATQLRMQDAFIRGEATGFVSVLSHPDTIRYVQVWNKGDDGSIVSTHIDLNKTTGRDFTHEEGATLIHHLQSIHGGDAIEQSSYVHFFVRDTVISEEAIRTVAMAHTPASFVFENFGRDVLRDTTDSMMTLGTYLREHIERKILAFKESTRSKKRISPVEPPAHRVAERSSDTTKRARLVDAANEKRDDGAQDTRRTQTNIREPVQSIFAEWWVTKRIVGYVDHVPVAAVAALTWTTRDAAISSIVPKELVIPHKRDIQKPAIKKMKAFVFFEKKNPRAELQTNKRESNLVRIYLRDIVPLHLRVVQRKTMQFIRRIFEIIKSPQTGTIKSESQDFHDTLKPMIVKNIVFAFRLLRIIRVSRLRRHVDVQEHKPSRREASVFETVSSRGILLSIIWYLALLREVGFAKKKHKKKKGRSLLWHHISLRFVIE